MSDSRSLRMLTSSASQYLHPDYLQPLPTTLDAKKSPLALLAQTCSSIGKDSSPSKSIIPPLEKTKDASKSESPASVKSSGTDGRKSTPSTEKREGSSPNGEKSSFRAPAPKDIPPLVPIPGGGDKSPRGSPEASTAKPTEGTSSSSTVATTASSHHSSSKLNLSSATLDLSHSEATSATSVPRSSSTLVTSSLAREGLPTPATGSLPPTLPPYPGCGLPFMPHHFSALDPSSPSYHASLAAHTALASQKAALGVAGLSGNPLSGTSPYVAYAHVKTASGATTLVPICRDPYCTNCQLTVQNTQLTRCGAGCTQCNHDKTLPSSSSLAASGLPLLPPSGSSGLATSVSNPYAYPHSLGLLAGHHGLPYVCNWMSGSEYCGKRFTTSEELLQHLRTHTSSTDSSLASLPAYSLGLPTPGALGCHSHYTTPGSLSPNSLRSSYPRSLSPNTLLAANSRYHPYKPPGLSALPTPPALPSLPAGITPYYSPYALYSQRLGAVAP